MTHDEMIEVIAAHRAGKTIQYRSKDSELDWIEKSPLNKLFDFKHTQYRIKPEPLTLAECWKATCYADGLVSDEACAKHFLKLAKENGHV